MNRDKFNASGCKDLTAYQALRNIESDRIAEAKYKKLLAIISDICELAGFRPEGKIALRDKKTGKIWR